MQLSRVRIPLNCLTPSHFCGPGFPLRHVYVKVSFVLSGLRWELVGDVIEYQFKLSFRNHFFHMILNLTMIWPCLCFDHIWVISPFNVYCSFFIHLILRPFEINNTFFLFNILKIFHSSAISVAKVTSVSRTITWNVQL